MIVNDLNTKTRYYSIMCGHRYWYYTGRNWTDNGFRKGIKVYEFADVCDHTETFTAEDIEKYFEVK